MQIVALMHVPKPSRDVAWLKDSLQAAIELELSTIPVYLCAMWSIKTQAGTVYDHVKHIVFEEMLHLGLVCNLLTTIGGTPRIAAATTVPKYPGPLPGGVRPNLIVYLAGLTRQMVKEVFMEIEYPQAGPIAFALSTTFPTIGDFYDAVLDAFVQNAAAITGAKQLTASNNLLGELTAINTLDDARKAIGTIKEQGEGTTQSPNATDFGGGLAHYYKFAEIYHGKKLVKTAAGVWKYEGDPVPFPEVFPVARVPAEGYPDLPEAVAFDKLFTKLLQQLETAWATGDQDQLDDAMLLKMRKLTGPARSLMQKPLDAGDYTYGPSFQFVTG
jgi:hypothetical protein